MCDIHNACTIVRVGTRTHFWNLLGTNDSPWIVKNNLVDFPIIMYGHSVMIGPFFLAKTWQKVYNILRMRIIWFAAVLLCTFMYWRLANNTWFVPYKYDTNRVLFALSSCKPYCISKSRKYDITKWYKARSPKRNPITGLWGRNYEFDFTLLFISSWLSERPSMPP